MAGSAASAQDPSAPSQSVPYVRIDSMIGTSARPLSVSAYSTRGGTSGNVWRATMPSSSSARRRSERVRGEIPSSERSSSQKRARPSARSRITSRVHLPQTMSAVRQTGQSEFGTIPSLAARLQLLKYDVDVPLVGPAQDREGERRVRLEGVEQRIDGGQRLVVDPDEQVAALEPGAPGRAVLHHPAHEQAVALGQADGGAHPPGGARRGER